MLVLHWLTWITITIAALMSLSVEPAINFQCSYWIMCSLIVSYLFAHWLFEKRSQEEEYGPMSARTAFLLLVEILLQKEELVYLLLIDPFSYCFLLLFCAAYLAYDFVWRTFYKFQEVDDMCYLVLFGLTGILHDVYYKKSLWPIIAWTFLTILIRLGWIWWQQWVIFSLGNSAPDDLIRMRIVSIQCTDPIIGDSGHVYVVVGNDYTFEIFKQGPNRFTALPVRQERDLRRNVHQSRFYIPLIQYGVLGITTWSDQVIKDLYNQEFKGIENEYNSSYKSCQEFAFLLVDSICISPARLNIRMTLLKSLMTAIVLYSVPLLIILISRVEIHYRP